MDTNNYEKMLYKLFLKGMIDEETLEQKMEERKNKKFKEDVSQEIIETEAVSHIKKHIERIYAERFKKEE